MMRPPLARSSPSIRTTPTGTSDDTDRGMQFGQSCCPASSHSSERAPPAPCHPRDHRELQSTVMAGQDAGGAQVVEGSAQFGIEGSDGRFAHMRARESTLRMAALQVLVDRRSPGVRTEALLSRNVKQTPLT